MRRPEINIDAKREWQTYYAPEMVGEYLYWHDSQNPYNPGELIDFKPGMIILTPPEPSLDGFLRWASDHTSATLLPQQRIRKGKGSDVKHAQ